jgi:hypothetical protein
MTKYSNYKGRKERKKKNGNKGRWRRGKRNGKRSWEDIMWKGNKEALNDINNTLQAGAYLIWSLACGNMKQ